MAAFGCTGLVLTLLFGSYMLLDDKGRDKRQGVEIRVEGWAGRGEVQMV